MQFIALLLIIVVVIIMLVVFLPLFLILLGVAVAASVLAWAVGFPITVTRTIGDEKYEIGRVRWFSYREHAKPINVGKKD